MVDDDSSAMGDYLRRQKRMGDLFKTPWWAKPYEPSWMKAINPPRFAFDDFPTQKLVSSETTDAIARISGASAISRDLASGLTGGSIDPLGIAKLNQTLVASVFGSNGISTTTKWAVKSAFSDMASSHLGILDHISDFIPKFGSPALDALGKTQVQKWARAGAQALDDYSPEPLADETRVSVDEVEQREVDDAFAELIERVRTLEEQQEAQAATSTVVSEQVQAIYQTTVADAPKNRLSDRQFQIIVALVVLLLGYILNPPGVPSPSEPPRIEAPGVLASPSDVQPSSGPTTPEDRTADYEPKDSE